MERLSVEDRDGYTEFRFSGDVSLAGVVQTLRDVHRECQERESEWALVDLTATSGTLTGMERFEVARRLIPDWTRSIGLAIVVKRPQTLPGRIGQLVAQNRGLKVRVFTERAPAIGWIESKLA